MTDITDTIKRVRELDERATKGEWTASEQESEPGEWEVLCGEKAVARYRYERDSARARLAKYEAVVGRLDEWVLRYGKALTPHGSWRDSFGDGMRAAKAEIGAVLRALDEDIAERDRLAAAYARELDSSGGSGAGDLHRARSEKPMGGSAEAHQGDDRQPAPPELAGGSACGHCDAQPCRCLSRSSLIGAIRRAASRVGGSVAAALTALAEELEK